MSAPTYHTCACCGRSYTAAEWDALPGALGGREMQYEPGLLVELRNCDCGGTMQRDAVPTVLSLLEVA